MTSMCRPYLIGVVGADVAQRGGSRLAEQCRRVALQAAHVDAFGVRDVAERRGEDRRGAGCGGGGGREAGQALCQAVHVHLDL